MYQELKNCTAPKPTSWRLADKTNGIKDIAHPTLPTQGDDAHIRIGEYAEITIRIENVVGDTIQGEITCITPEATINKINYSVGDKVQTSWIAHYGITKN